MEVAMFSFVSTLIISEMKNFRMWVLIKTKTVVCETFRYHLFHTGKTDRI